MSKSSSGGCGCGGLLVLVVFIFFVYAWIWGVPIGDKVWNIDIFPPAIHETSSNPVINLVPEPVPFSEEWF